MAAPQSCSTKHHSPLVEATPYDQAAPCAYDSLPLHEAVSWRLPGMVITKLCTPVSIDASDDEGNTALHLLMEHAEQLNRKRIEVTIEQMSCVAGSSTDMQDKLSRFLAYAKKQSGCDSQSAAYHHDKIVCERLETVQSLISQRNINWQNSRGMTALHLAVRKHHYDLVRLLLWNDVDVDLTNLNGSTALHLACLNKAPVPIIKLLISRHNVNMKDKYGNTALHYASASSSMIKLLLEKGADKDVVNDRLETALVYALQQKTRKFEDISGLVSERNVNLRTIDGHTALALLVQHQKPLDLVPVLIAKGADRNMSCKITRMYRGTILHLAVYVDFPDYAIEELITPENINYRGVDDNDPSPLMLAINMNRGDLIDMLVGNGADVELPSIPLCPFYRHIKRDLVSMGIIWRLRKRPLLPIHAFLDASFYRQGLFQVHRLRSLLTLKTHMMRNVHGLTTCELISALADKHQLRQEVNLIYVEKYSELGISLKEKCARFIVKDDACLEMLGKIRYPRRLRLYLLHISRLANLGLLYLIDDVDEFMQVMFKDYHEPVTYEKTMHRLSCCFLEQEIQGERFYKRLLEVDTPDHGKESAEQKTYIYKIRDLN